MGSLRNEKKKTLIALLLEKVRRSTLFPTFNEESRGPSSRVFGIFKNVFIFSELHENDTQPDLCYLHSIAGLLPEETKTAHIADIWCDLINWGLTRWWLLV